MAEYAIIIPTLNEAGNVRPLVERLGALLCAYDWEIIFVDDNSGDGTLDILREMATNNPRIRFLRRVGRRGLSSACVEGMLATTATYLVVMDADLQHDESKITELFSLLDSGQATVAVASRYVAGGGTEAWNHRRLGMSKLATFLSKKLLTADCSDPMSGFFAIHRNLIDTSPERIHTHGFKILFDLLSRRDLPLIVREVPYIFKGRASGTTKLNSLVMLDFAWLLLSKYFRRLVHPELMLFCCVGLLGVGAHMFILYLLHKLLCSPFVLSQSLATLSAMTCNYFLNNRITFSPYRLRGKAMLTGYLKFVAACSIGTLANIALASFLFKASIPWPISAFFGVLLGALINYSFSKLFVWKSR